VRRGGSPKGRHEEVTTATSFPPYDVCVRLRRSPASGPFLCIVVLMWRHRSIIAPCPPSHSHCAILPPRFECGAPPVPGAAANSALAKGIGRPLMRGHKCRRPCSPNVSLADNSVTSAQQRRAFKTKTPNSNRLRTVSCKTFRGCLPRGLLRRRSQPGDGQSWCATPLLGLIPAFSSTATLLDHTFDSIRARLAGDRTSLINGHVRAHAQFQVFDLLTSHAGNRHSHVCTQRGG
jgi:hypothetical protein